MIHKRAVRDRERCHCKLISLVEEKQEKAFLKLDKPQPQLDAGKPWLWYGRLPCFIQSQGKFRADKVGQVCYSSPPCYRCSGQLSFQIIPLVHCLSLQRTDERGWERLSGITKCCSFREITTKSSCVFGFLSRHISTAESLSGFLPFFPLIREHSEGRLWCSQSQSKLLCLGDTRPAWLAGPLHRDSAGFNYPQLCFISLPSWALCPSVLCKYAAFTLKSRWDTQMSVHTHWGWRAATHRESACTDE